MLKLVRSYRRGRDRRTLRADDTRWNRTACRRTVWRCACVCCWCGSVETMRISHHISHMATISWLDWLRAPLDHVLQASTLICLARFVGLDAVPKQRSVALGTARYRLICCSVSCPRSTYTQSGGYNRSRRKCGCSGEAWLEGGSEHEEESKGKDGVVGR